jgi:hypothetical protein
VRSETIHPRKKKQLRSVTRTAQEVTTVIVEREKYRGQDRVRRENRDTNDRNKQRDRNTDLECHRDRGSDRDMDHDWKGEK